MFKDKNDFIEAYKNEFIEESGNAFEDSDMERKYFILVNLIREKAAQNWVKSGKHFSQNGYKQVFYFSMEFLLGKLLKDYLLNLGIYEVVAEGLADMGLDLDALSAMEDDAGLGNGGLGRLAACFLDSMAYLSIPGHGNGIRYRYGFFKQKIVDGYQTETPDNWLVNGYPWEIRKPEKAVIVKYKGTVEEKWIDGRLTVVHENYEPVRAVPYDVPIIGYGGEVINNLRLWSAEPVNNPIDLSSFNRGELGQAIKSRSEVEAISYILYPEDSNASGRELRLKQEYFFVAAGIENIAATYLKRGNDLRNFSQKIAIHINDTHPALAIPELMRVLMDVHGIPWEKAWETTVKTMSYTNHTILPEALERWDSDFFAMLLPRIYMIIKEIDRRYRESQGIPQDDQENPTAILHHNAVWMANLAVIGSHSVNGVAKLHTEILKTTVLQDFYRVFPERFNNKTNGVSHRRFLLKANPHLSNLISNAIGAEWIHKPSALQKLSVYREDQDFLTQLAAAKHANKCRLAQHIMKETGIAIDPDSIFDVHIKRIHAYKRQLLNVLKIMALYNRLSENPDALQRPVTFIFGGKAASGYHYAKAVIKLINTVAEKINRDPAIKDKIKVVFLENFNVSSSEIICPAADISEQISTASKEASGTGNMKFMFNGAVTLGTLDGANVEIFEIVGPEHMAVFGLSAEEVLHLYKFGGYCSRQVYDDDATVHRVVDQLMDGFLPGGCSEFSCIYNDLLRENDPFFVIKDFASYMETWERLVSRYENREEWQRISLMNIAGAGYFSSDRTIKEYADEIWHIPYQQN